ncbi:hypothetical protein H8356DRAFT_1077008 [Neocallimastix lanati (nom. inval.)]|nr:hypothetical protein H8356DRAFT_1077008 [Neocallimastix sp. JGI-2020a]
MNENNIIKKFENKNEIDEVINNSNKNDNVNDNDNESEIVNYNENTNKEKQLKKRKKVTQACENCRKKRRKCTGERPKCLTCQQYNYICYYNPFPKKRGPQQKRKKRKYRRREKGKKDYDIRNENKLNEYCNNFNVSVIKNKLNKGNEESIQINSEIFNDYLAFHDTIFFKDKEVINNEPPFIGSESINYVVINYYYKYFHPIYPIINYNSFAVHAKNGTLTKYLVYAMYGLAFYFKPDTEKTEAFEYIDQAKALVLQNYGNDQDWLYSVLGIRIIANNSLWLMNVKKNNYVIKEDIEDMKNMSIILLSFDTWIGLTHNEYTDILQKKLYINQRSKLIMDLTSDVLTTDYEYYVSCVNIFILEIYHIALKIKANEFSVEEIDCINMDILRTQHFFLKTMEDFTLIPQRIYVNRMYIMNVINDPEKIKKYPIAKSIAIVCKSTDDCSICLKLLFESSEINNSLPLYFPFIKAWVFYQCAVIYSIRYIATYECKYNDNRQSLKYSTFSSFPQETLEPCYFYLNLLKDICKYFKTAKKYANSLKLLIYRTEKVVNERSFDVSFDDIII